MLLHRLLFVAAGASQADAIRRARSLGYVPYAIDADDQAPGFAFAEDFAVGDIKDVEFIVTCAERFDVDGILSVATDVPVPAVARACDRLGLTGLSIAAADISVNKLSQRMKMRELGLFVPDFESFTDFQQALDGANRIGLPVVIKPCDSAGSRGVNLVTSHDDLQRSVSSTLEMSRSRTGILEKFIDGNEVSVEGFAIDGRLHVICMSEKQRTKPPYLLDTRVGFPDTLPYNERDEIVTMVEKAVLGCGYNNCPVHVEVMRTASGPFIVEMAARGAGFHVFTRILPLVTGIDTIAVQLAMTVGKTPPTVHPHSCMGAVIVFISPTPGLLVVVEGLERARKIPGVEEIEIYKKPGAMLGELTCGADRLGHIIAYGENRQAAEQSATDALATIKVIVE